MFIVLLYMETKEQNVSEVLKYHTSCQPVYWNHT